MEFYGLIEHDRFASNRATIDAIKDACKKGKIAFNEVNVEKFDFLSFPELSEEDIVFRITSGVKSRKLEKLLINEKCKTIYHDNQLAYFNRGSCYYHNLKVGLPVIPTIVQMPQRFEDLKKAVELLDGYPVIFKKEGLSHGRGVSKIENEKELESRFEAEDGSTNLMIRKFIKHEKQYRLAVLGDEVLACHQNWLAPNDFRSNSGDSRLRKSEACDCEPDLKAIAIEAVASMGIDFGGVDILIDDQGDAYIAEVNAPFYFASTAKLCQVDIAGALVDHLMKK
ncbi:hypothetical protein COT97_00305 [Candidatus Falkowbacteria bacterium CG10_big_fil_rev_8_21_14_0_10_39_11]|uniref:ATP-grasp domain-containing protein n=1 Tax=Candidatus Falkowbacteria bacterium CG10_big_fil_rev_8_21_14_0_10_39_11 TaxID=1974565 RepID=A0A2H0V878_9BACT|nr:MAG: hypothetical protein COT97_00305 [Candidatus Falkowbacteria bacterium CG10_big_fil_rev_8_21_14_0_10_39_11]